MTLGDLKAALTHCEYQGATDETPIEIWDNPVLKKLGDKLEIIFLDTKIEIAAS